VIALAALLVAVAQLAVPPTAPPAGAPAAISVATAARSLRPGEIVILTITVPAGTERVTVRAFDRDITAYNVDEVTWRAILGIDLAVTARSYGVAIAAHQGTTSATLTHRLRVTARTFPTRRLRVDSAFVTPPKSEQPRIQREAAQLAALWTTPSSEDLWDGAFIAPVPERANSAFGARSVFNGQLRSRHSGADFPSKEGTPIQAPAAGRVVLAESLYFSGNTIVIDHGVGVFSLLAHLSEMAVENGDRVNVGDTLGRVGETGRVTGPHLHWAVRANGARVDPLSLLALFGS
jgi:murein DD-endopeptidase MepM/ murein hydrolase activator NlpD